MVQEVRNKFSFAGINRYIVGCKFVIYLSIYPTILELIDT